MVKIKITPSRFAEACSILEYQLVNNGQRDIIISILPRFVLGADGEYLVKVKTDEDGDITGFDDMQAAVLALAQVTPKRLEKLMTQFREAAQSIVNPTSGGDSTGPTSTDTGQPPPG